MSAKMSNLARIQEMHDIIIKTRRQISELGFTKERFLAPANDSDDLIAEGLLNRMLRLTEEMSNVDSVTAGQYSLDTDNARAVRNRLAHAYGNVDRGIVWEIYNDELDTILEGCRAYCEDMGVDLVFCDFC